MSRRTDDSSMALILIALIFLAVVGFWVRQQIQAFAGFTKLDFDTALALLRNIALFAVFFVGAWMLNLFRYVKTYIPAGVILVLIPALKFRAAQHIIPELSEFSPPGELLWYGRTWVIFMTLAALTALGYYWSDRD